MSKTLLLTACFLSVATFSSAAEMLGYAGNWQVGWITESNTQYCEVHWSAGERLVRFLITAPEDMTLVFEKSSWKIPTGAKTTVSTPLLPDPLPVTEYHGSTLVVTNPPRDVVRAIFQALGSTGVSFAFKGNEGTWDIPKMNTSVLDTSLNECSRRLEALPHGPSDSQPL